MLSSMCYESVTTKVKKAVSWLIRWSLDLHYKVFEKHKPPKPFKVFQTSVYTLDSALPLPPNEGTNGKNLNQLARLIQPDTNNNPKQILQMK